MQRIKCFLNLSYIYVIKKYMQKFITLILIIVITFYSHFGISQCSSLDTIIPIPDNERPIDLQLLIDGVINNDLSDPNQGVCRVTLNFEHYQRTDLTIELVSPSGQKVVLVGPFDPFNSPLTGKLTWDIAFIPCLDMASPDPGKSPYFNNNDNWQLGNNFSGDYYPNSGCLEDFDIGPVNGTWTFIVFDHDEIYKGNILGFSIEFCDGTITDCELCEADGGLFETTNLKFCELYQDISFDLNHVFINEEPDSEIYNFEYIIHKNNTIIDITKNPDFNGYGVGEYHICGFSYFRNDSTLLYDLMDSISIEEFIDSVETSGSPYCADISDTCLIVEILPIKNLVNIDTSFCFGDSILFNGEKIVTAGDHYISGINNNCDTLYVLSVKEWNLDATIDAPRTELNCDGGNLIIKGNGYTENIGMNFNWNKTLIPNGLDPTSVIIGAPGVYQFILSAGVCSDTASIEITSDINVPILDFELQDLNCDVDTAILKVSSSNTVLDSVHWSNGIDNYIGSTISVSTPGNYIVNAFTIGDCEGFETIEVQIDTVKPKVIINGADITCKNDTSFIHLDSNDSIRSIYWLELNSYLKEPFVLSGGTYHVEITGTNGCITLDSIFINEYTDTIAYSILSDTINCEGSPVLIDLETTEDSLSYLWISPKNDTFYTEDIFADTSGFYDLTITNRYGCVSKHLHKVNIDTFPPVLNIDMDTLYLSCGIDSVQLSFTSTDSIEHVNWIGPGNINTTEKFPLVPYEGNYYLTILDENQCSNSGIVTVIADTTVPDIVILTDTISCIDNTANINVKYSGNYSFAWKDPAQIPHVGSIISSLLSGFFYLTVTDNDNNCTNEFFTYVPLDTAKPVIDILTSNDFDCTHDSVYLNYYSSVDPKFIKWTGNGLNDTSDLVLIKDPGKYYLEITASSYCSDIDSITLEDGGFIEVLPDTFYLTCENNRSVQLYIDGIPDSFNFEWSNQNFYSEEFMPIVTEDGIYKVKVYNGECIDSNEIVVYYDTLVPQVNINYDAVIECNPDYSVLNAEINNIENIDSFSWSGPGFQSNKLVDTVYTEGQYRFYAIGKNGCTYIYIFDIYFSQNYPSIEAIGDTINCINGIHDLTINANISSAYSNLKWEGPNNYESESLYNTVVDSGFYFLQVITDQGCISYDSVYVSIDTSFAEINFFPVDTITCYKDTIELALTTNANNPIINWNGPNGFEANTTNIDINRGGEYRIEIINDNGCISRDTIQVPINKLKPYISLESEGLTCKDSKTTIFVNSTADNFSTHWTGPDGYNSNEKDITINVEGIYYIQLIDQLNGCESFDSILISWDSIPPDIFSQDYYLPCDGSEIEMLAYSNSMGSDFTWFGPNGFYYEGFKTSTNIPGEYTIWFTSNENGCSNSKTINVFDIPIPPEFEVYGDNINCYSDSAILKAVGVDDDKYFQWSGPNGFTSEEEEPVVYEEGEYSLYVLGQNNCDTSKTITVVSDTIHPQLSIEFLDSFICDKQNGKLDIIIENQQDVLYSYEWFTEDGSIVHGNYSKSPNIEGEGTYFIKLMNTDNGCASFDSVSIVSNTYDLDSVKIILKQPTCYGYSDGSFEIDTVYGGVAPYYFSLDNYWFSNIKSFNSKKSGTYNLYIKDTYGCKLDTIILIYDGVDVQLKLGVDKNNIYLGDSVNVKALILADNGIENYYWNPEELFSDFDTTNQVIHPLKSMEISLKVEDVNGCSDEDALWIEVIGKPDVYIPNIFTPNGDGVNDYFYMKSGSGIKSISKLMIFDRWGEKVFEKKNLKQNVPNDGWNGKYKGKNVQAGVYVYQFILELENGLIENLSGDITILK